MSEIDNIFMMEICEEKYKLECYNHNMTFDSYYDYYNYITNNISKEEEYYKFYIDRGNKEQVTIIMRNSDNIINYITRNFVKKLI